MKKFISIALLLALCLSLFAGCDKAPVEEPASDLANAKAYLFNMYNKAGKDEANKIIKDTDVTTVVTIGGIPYSVEWKVEITAGAAESVKLAESSTANSIKIDITEQPEEQVEFTLTGTVSDGKGGSESVVLKYYTPAVEKPQGGDVTTATVVTEPKAGVPFKLGMFQGNLGKTLYFAGTTANKDYYMTTTEDIKEATDVTLEAVDGGYKIFFMADGAKTYLDVFQSGDYVNLRLTTEPTAVWTWNTEFNTLVADVAGTLYYCGTYKEYNTLSASKLDYAATSFPSNLYAVENKTATATAVETPAAGIAYKLGMFQGNLGKTLYFAGTTANKDYYMTTTEALNEATDVTLEAVDGGFKIFFMANGTKTYLDVFQSGDYVNLRLTTEPTAVWTWNTEYKTLVADVAGTLYYCGTYKEYNTLSASKLDYAATSFPSNLFTLG